MSKSTGSILTLNTLTIRKPTDCHIHLRDGPALLRTVTDAATQFFQAIVMPNLSPPITQAEQVIAYRNRIVENIPNNHTFFPRMTLYLTDQTTPDIIRQAQQIGITAVKLYPAGATTNSKAGVTKIASLYPILELLEELSLPLCIHGETANQDIDIFDQEANFIASYLIPITNRFQNLKIILEHITTSEAVQFVESTSNKIAATITPHHLKLNRNDLLQGGIKPHYYCLPVLKRKSHQQALIKAATCGNPKFFMGTDSAPHTIANKQSACGCAGIYNAHVATVMYADIFDQANALDKLESFTSIFGAEFYNLPIADETLTLIKKTWQMPNKLAFEDTFLKPFGAGENLQWQIQ